MPENSNQKFLLVAGSAKSVLNFRGHLIQELMKRNFEVHLATSFSGIDESFRSRIVEMGVLVHDLAIKRTGLNPFYDLITLYTLIKLMKRLKPSYVLSYTIKPVIYSTLSARLCNVPHIFCLITGLGYTFDAKDGNSKILGSILHFLSKFLYRTSLRFAELVFFQNSDDERLFRQLRVLGNSTRSIVVRGSGVDTDHYYFSPVNSSIVHFLFVGRLLINKGVREYVEAAKIIAASNTNIKFSIAGRFEDGPNSITKLEFDTWLSDGLIEYQGELTDVRDSIRACSVFVLPSYREGTPRSVLEAMSIGRAIITTDAPGCRDTVSHGVNGYLIQIKSIDELVLNMQKFINTPELMLSMGTESRNIVVAKYDVHGINAVMLKEMRIDSD